jgi:hypothetical protein
MKNSFFLSSIASGLLLSFFIRDEFFNIDTEISLLLAPVSLFFGFLFSALHVASNPGKVRRIWTEMGAIATASGAIFIFVSSLFIDNKSLPGLNLLLCVFLLPVSFLLGIFFRLKGTGK